MRYKNKSKAISSQAQPPALACGSPGLCHQGLYHRLKGNLLWHLEHLFSSCFTDLGAWIVVYFPLSHSLTAAGQLFLLFFKYHRSSTIIADGLSFGQQWVHLGASWNCPCLCRGRFFLPLTEASPGSLPLWYQKPWHINPKHRATNPSIAYDDTSEDKIYFCETICFLTL